MNNNIKVIVATLTLAVVGLSIGLGVALANGGDDESGMYWRHHSGGYYGMMNAMGRGDWAGMRDYMRTVLGDEGYQQMSQHMKTDVCGWTAASNDPTGFMHDMSYGMMYRAFNDGASPPPASGCW